MLDFQKHIKIRKSKFSISVGDIYGNIFKKFAESKNIPLSNVIDAILAEKFMEMTANTISVMTLEQEELLKELQIYIEQENIKSSISWSTAQLEWLNKTADEKGIERSAVLRMAVDKMMFEANKKEV